MANKNGSLLDFPGAFVTVLVLGAMAVIFLVAWPAELLHGNARWIGESLWLGIPGLVAAAIFTAHRLRTRDERKLARLRENRLWAEGTHPAQVASRQRHMEQEKQRLITEQRRKEAAQARKAAIEAKERRKRKLREEIQQEEQLLREALHRKNPPRDPAS